MLCLPSRLADILAGGAMPAFLPSWAAASDEREELIFFSEVEVFRKLC
jgi:hypothetical protein